MKKILSATLLFATALLMFTACAGEQEDIFDKSAAERLNEVSSVYTQRLTSSAAGWAMEYYPTNGTSAPTGSGYLLLADFNTDESVTMGAKNDYTDGAYLSEKSTWDVITDNGPVLSFNSYNKCLHIFSDPGFYSTGLGLEGDYEFVMVDVPENGEFIMLKGKKRSTYIRLTRLADGTDFETYIADVQNFHKTIFPASAPNDALLHLGDSAIVLGSGSTGIAEMYPYGGDAITETTSHPFLFTMRNGKYYLRFRDALTMSDGTEVKEFEYQPESDYFISTDNDACTITGGDPVEFFWSNVNSSSHRWQWNSSTSMSESFSAQYTALAQAFKSLKYTLNNMSLRQTSDGIVCRVQYRTSRSSATVDYKFNATKEADGVTLQYVEPASDAASNVLNAMPTLSAILNTLSQKFIISGNGTTFNLSTVKLTAANDASLWFAPALY